MAPAALERVDEIAGSIRYHGKKAVGIKARKNPATDDDVKVFAELMDLEELELQGETITDAAVNYLVGLPALHHLSLENTSITDEGVANLQRLSLRKTCVTDAGVAEIAKIESLEEQDLELLQISEKGLAQLSNLKRLNLAMVVVPDEAVTALQATIPGLDVFRWRIPGGWR